MLAALHLAGGLAMFALVFQKSFVPFFVTMLVYMLVYVPTLSLTNSICFQHLQDPQKQFGSVRLWGTIGWIAASWPFVFILRGKEGAALESALMACLEKSRAKRPQTARDLALLIARCAEASQWSIEDADAWWGRHERGQASVASSFPIPSAPTASDGRDVTIDLPMKR